MWTNNDYELLRGMHIEPGPRVDPGDMPITITMRQRLDEIDMREATYRAMRMWRRRCFAAWALAGVLGAAGVILAGVVAAALWGWL